MNCKYGEVLSTSKDIYSTVTEHVTVGCSNHSFFLSVIWGWGLVFSLLADMLLDLKSVIYLTLLQSVNSIYVDLNHKYQKILNTHGDIVCCILS